MSALWAIFSLRRFTKFLSSPAGKLVLVLVLMFSWTLYHRIDARRGCEAAELAKDLEEANRQLVIAQEIADEARVKADQTEAEMAGLEQSNEELKAAIDAGYVATCPVPDDVRDRLLRIR